MPPVAILIIQGIQAAIVAAPKAIELVKKGKDYIAALFGAGIITKEQQDQLHAHIDAITAALNAGQVPPAWEVEDDPDDE